ncbi:MAG: RCC1 domain-containing protein [Polyangiales bacterium]
MLPPLEQNDSRIAFRLIAVFAWLVVAGCGDSLVSFRVAFEDEASQARARVVQLDALAGGCEGTESIYGWTLDRDTTPEASDLPDGRYGIRVRATDATCQRFAMGCVEVDLPRTDDVLIELTNTDSTYVCGARTCEDGRCDEEPEPGAIRTMGLGEGESCSVSEQGALSCWGSNDQGQLSLSERPNVLAPTVVGTERFVAVDLGFRNTCAITEAGDLQCAGLNEAGAVGVGDRSPRSSLTPVAADIRFTSVSTGYEHTCAIAEDSSLYCWGQCCTQLGAGAQTEDLLVPNRISDGWTQVSAGGFDGAGHTCAIRMDGSLWCWGDNHRGQLGVGDLVDRDEPTQLSQPVGPWAQVHVGGDFTCAIRHDTTLWCWGYSQNGALGVGSVDGAAQPLPLEHAEDGWTALAAGARTACALKQDGSLWCWGLNASQQLGQADMAELPGALSPLRTHAETEWRGVFGGQRHMCALDSDGGAFCWGNNAHAELGGGSVSEPTPVATRVMLP